MRQPEAIILLRGEGQRIGGPIGQVESPDDRQPRICPEPVEVLPEEANVLLGTSLREPDPDVFGEVQQRRPDLPESVLVTLRFQGNLHRDAHLRSGRDAPLRETTVQQRRQDLIELTAGENRAVRFQGKKPQAVRDLEDLVTIFSSPMQETGEHHQGLILRDAARAVKRAADALCYACLVEPVHGVLVFLRHIRKG